MLTPNRELKAAARQAMDGYWWSAMGLLVILLLYIVVVAVFTLGIGNLFLFPPVIIGYYLFFLKRAKGQDASIGDLFLPFRYYGKAFLTYLLYSIIMLLAASISLILFYMWFISTGLSFHDLFFNSNPSTVALVGNPDFLSFAYLFLLIPIYFGLRLSMVYFILNDNPNLPADKVIGLSWKLTRGAELKLLGLLLSYILWYIVIILTFFIAALYVLPYLSAALAMFYLDLKKNSTYGQEIDNYGKEIVYEAIPE